MEGRSGSQVPAENPLDTNGEGSVLEGFRYEADIEPVLRERLQN